MNDEAHFFSKNNLITMFYSFIYYTGVEIHLHGKERKKLLKDSDIIYYYIFDLLLDKPMLFEKFNKNKDNQFLNSEEKILTVINNVMNHLLVTNTGFLDFLKKEDRDNDDNDLVESYKNNWTVCNRFFHEFRQELFTNKFNLVGKYSFQEHQIRQMMRQDFLPDQDDEVIIITAEKMEERAVSINEAMSLKKELKDVLDSYSNESLDKISNYFKLNEYSSYGNYGSNIYHTLK